MSSIWILHHDRNHCLQRRVENFDKLRKQILIGFVNGKHPTIKKSLRTNVRISRHLPINTASLTARKWKFQHL